MIPSQESLPTAQDFDPWNGCLDAQKAWNHFGGKTLAEARTTFRSNPLYYQEDFMFMGGVAFAYYFPVIEDHLYAARDIEGDGDHQAWILAKCIHHQFSFFPSEQVRQLGSRVAALAEFVVRNLHRFGGDETERRKVAVAWGELASLVALNAAHCS